MTTPARTKPVRLALDVMGADRGVNEVLSGLALARARGLTAAITLFGREAEIRAGMTGRDIGEVRVVHADDIINMDEKPTHALKRGRNSSMWASIAAVKAEEADGVVSSGNTGALMAMGVYQLRAIDGIDRPALGAMWPTHTGRALVLDVGANVEATARQLVQFAIMGEAYFRALTGKAQPSVALLNVGAEELKGHDLVRSAATILREADTAMNFAGFVEGSDISDGGADVIVTDGFTGNVALKTAEGTARLVGGWVKTALNRNLLAKAGALLMLPSLKLLKAQMNPSTINGAPLLGLNGLVLKSHGGADAEGIAAALRMAETLACHPIRDEIARTVKTVEARAAERRLDQPPVSVVAQ